MEIILELDCVCVLINYSEYFCVCKRISIGFYHIREVIYIDNRTGPSTDPCGTPEVTDFQANEIDIFT